MNIFTPLTYLSIGLEELSAIDDITSVSPELVKEFVDFQKGNPATLQVPATVDSLNQITHFVATLGQRVNLEHIEQSKLKIAVYEACINVIEHGYKYEPGHHIWVDVLYTGKTFEVTIKDNGSSFDFYNVKPYDVQEAFNGKRKSGYGLYIIMKSVDDVKYESDPQKGNRLTLVKKVK